MGSKKININKAFCAFCVCAISGILVGSIVTSLFNTSHFDRSYDFLGRWIRDGLVTLAVKFIHFLIARGLQMRYMLMLQPHSTVMSMLFWLLLTRSTSSVSELAL